MTVPTVACTNCGKNFTTDDLRGTSCKYCGTLLAHHARAQQQVAVVQQMMADRNGNGIPDMYEGVVANAQANAMNQAFGQGFAPPPNPYAPMPYGVMGQAVQIQAAGRTASKVMVIVMVAVFGATFLIIGLGAAMFFFLAH